MDKSDITNFFSNDYFSIDATNLPFLYIQFQTKEPTEEEFREHIEQLSIFCLREEPYVMIMEFLDSGYLKSQYRIRLGNWLKSNQKQLKNTCRGVAYISSSVIHQIILQCVFTVQPPPFEYVVVRTKEKGEEWLKEQLVEQV